VNQIYFEFVPNLLPARNNTAKLTAFEKPIIKFTEASQQTVC
jgi:hypothetical protein